MWTRSPGTIFNLFNSSGNCNTCSSGTVFNLCNSSRTCNTSSSGTIFNLFSSSGTYNTRSSGTINLFLWIIAKENLPKINYNNERQRY